MEASRRLVEDLVIILNLKLGMSSLPTEQPPELLRTTSSPLLSPRRRRVPSRKHQKSVVSSKILEQFEDLDKTISRDIPKQLESIDSENLRLLTELNEKYSYLEGLNDRLAENVESVGSMLTELDATKEDVQQIDSTGLFNNLDDLNVRLDSVRTSLKDNKDKLTEFDSSLAVLEGAKRKSLVVQKTRTQAAMAVGSIFAVLILLRLANLLV